MRLRKIKTIHGVIETPVFMPDATRGFIKTLGAADLANLKMGPLVVNTLHLYLQPGMKIIKKAGGIHKFMDWHGPLLSDSGGYQVFSLIHKNPKMGKITDEGAIFKSPIDGSKHILTPEKSIQIQFDLGVDMMVCLDDCPPNDYDREKIERAVERTIKWAKRCKFEYDKRIRNMKLTPLPPFTRGADQHTPLRKGGGGGLKRPLLFAVIQGGADLELRRYCAEELIKIGFDGYGFGARPVDGEGKFLGDILKRTAEMIPENSLRFALGIGLPEDIMRCVFYGWDIFDCVIPTREGRHGRLFFWKRNSKFKIPNSKFQIQNKFKIPKFYYSVNILNSKFSRDFSPINSRSTILELREYSKAYLHHLFKLKEPLGARLATLNNLEFYLELMGRLREEDIE
jgi:queuine tRNA-ribosyltransferase